MKYLFEIDGRKIEISNPDKILWPKAMVSKLDLIDYTIKIAPYILPYLKNRLLTTIRYPDGVEGKSFYQKNKPNFAPDWIKSVMYEGTEYIVAEDRATLVYLANLACIELHISFHTATSLEPLEIVFDLDPSVDDFRKVIKTALLIKEELDQLKIPSYIKTSGASGLQIFLPLKRGHTFEETRLFASFFARYMANKYPSLITIERMVKKRGDKVYFDYLQHWKGKSLIAPYSTRAKEYPYVSAPLLWSEVPFCSPKDFTIMNIIPRLKKKGDLFQPLLQQNGLDLKPLLNIISSKV